MRKSISAILLSFVLLGGTTPARAGDDELKGHKIEHVLLISVDGLHALDLSNYIASHPNSTLAGLSKHGLTYSNVQAVVRIPGVEELNIGHSIVSRAVLVGMERAVREMKEAMR